MKSKLVLVSGGAGFIGSHTADLLLKKGYRVRILDNLSSKTHNGKWPGYLDKRIEKIKGDVRNINDWKKALKGVNLVIHLAAWMDLMPEFSKFFGINVLGTANLYQVIVANKFPIEKVVVASSQFVYGQGKWRCKKDGEVYPKDRKDEDIRKGFWDLRCPKCNGEIKPLLNTEDYQDPPNQYAISKYTQEMMAMKLGKLYGIPSTALRYSIVHGSRQTLKNVYSGALRIFTLQLLSGEGVTIYEDGQQLRDYVSVKDVACANVLVMESKKTDFEVFNVGGGKGYKVMELVEIVADALRKDKSKLKTEGEYRVGDIRHAVSSIKKLENLGWKPQVSEAESVADFVAWVKKDKNIDFKRLMKADKNMKKLGVVKKSNG